jgi:hypothetical protein
MQHMVEIRRLLGVRRVATVAGYAALGPITGPLTARMVANWRRGDRMLAGIYAFAIVETAVLLPLWAGAALNHPFF